MLTGTFGYEEVSDQSGHEPMPTLLTPLTKIRIVVIPGLAAEIGGPEQQIFGQVLWLIQNRGQLVDGRYWARASASHLHEHWLTHLTETYIDAILRKLEDDLELLDSRSDLNNTPFDRTKWYALNIEKVSKLKSVVLGWESAKPHVGSIPAPVVMDSGIPRMESHPSRNASRPQSESEPHSGRDVNNELKDSKTLKDEDSEDDDGKSDSVSSSSSPNGHLSKVISEITKKKITNKQVLDVAETFEAEGWITPKIVTLWAERYWPDERPPNAKRPAPWPGQLQEGVIRDRAKLLKDAEPPFVGVRLG